MMLSNITTLVALATLLLPCVRSTTCTTPAQWSQWSDVTPCANFCAGSKHQVTRTCEAATPSPNTCSSDKKICGFFAPNQAQTVFADCGNSWSEWAASGGCVTTCGSSGVQSYTRTCEQSCTCTGPASKQESCGAGCCPTSAAWSSWSSFGSCGVTCGTGTQEYRRDCQDAVCGGGTTCATDDSTVFNQGEFESRVSSCTVNACCPENGDWQYSSWSGWSQTCPTTGARSRTVAGCTAKCGGECPNNPLTQQTRTKQDCDNNVFTTTTTMKGVETTRDPGDNDPSGSSAPASFVISSVFTGVTTADFTSAVISQFLVVFEQTLSTEVNGNSKRRRASLIGANVTVNSVTSNSGNVIVSYTVVTTSGQLSDIYCASKKINANGALLRALQTANAIYSSSTLLLGATSSCTSCSCSSGLSGEEVAMIIGIVMGSIVAILLGAFMVYYCRSQQEIDRKQSIYEDTLKYQNQNANPLYSQPKTPDNRSSLTSYTSALAYEDYVPQELRVTSPTRSSGLKSIEPEVAIMKDEQGFTVLARMTPGEYRQAVPEHLGKLNARKGHVIVARRPGGGYALIQRRDDGLYHAVRTSRSDNEIIVVHTKLGKPALLIKGEDGHMKPMAQFAGAAIDPGTIFGVALGPSKDRMHVLCLRKPKKTSKAAPMFMILQKGAGNTFDLMAWKESGYRAKTVQVPTLKKTWMGLHREGKSDRFKRISNTTQPTAEGGTQAQGLNLLDSEFLEVLTGRGSSSGPLVSLLRKTVDDILEADYSVMERNDSGVYNLAQLADEGGRSLHVKYTDGRVLKLQRADDGYLEVDVDAYDEDKYLEVLTGETDDGDVSLLSNPGGQYTVLQKSSVNDDSRYIRPDVPGSTYLTLKEVQRQIAQSQASTPREKAASFEYPAVPTSPRPNKKAVSYVESPIGHSSMSKTSEYQFPGIGMEYSITPPSEVVSEKRYQRVSSSSSVGRPTLGYISVSNENENEPQTVPMVREEAEGGAAGSKYVTIDPASQISMGGMNKRFSNISVQSVESRSSNYASPRSTTAWTSPRSNQVSPVASPPATTSQMASSQASQSSLATAPNRNVQNHQQQVANGLGLSGFAQAGQYKQRQPTQQYQPPPSSFALAAQYTRKPEQKPSAQVKINPKRAGRTAAHASTKVDGAKAQKMLMAFGAEDGSYVLQGDESDPNMAWLHMCHNGKMLFHEIEIDEDFEGGADATEFGEFVCQDLDEFVSTYSYPSNALPCPLGSNLTPN